MTTIGKETSPKNPEVRRFETETHELNLEEGPRMNIGLHSVAISLRAATGRNATVALKIMLR